METKTKSRIIRETGRYVVCLTIQRKVKGEASKGAMYPATDPKYAGWLDGFRNALDDQEFNQLCSVALTESSNCQRG